MKIDDNALKVIEKVFDIELYEYQKDYLLDKIQHLNTGRRSGKTFAYCIKLALSEGDTLDFRRKSYEDEEHGSNYKRWFKSFFYDVWIMLKNAGFPVRKVIWK